MSHDVTSVLTDILIVLVAAKVAAELAERVRIPAVVGEILAGILVGPSVLGLVGSDDVLRTLGELGVVLLLLEVGMEMDLGELGKVGRTSLLVAVVGVVAPLVLGLGAMLAIGDDFNTALFVAAALTATSVGITARVFGDLKALATTEARIVLGAAVADDVIGLVVLTVVVRIVTEGSVSLASLAWIIVVAVGFLVVGGAIALKVAPPLFAQIELRSRSAGTIVALALAFTLAFAELADVAKLAVVVGAFLAGLALGRSAQSERIHRELSPVGHLFIPVFFLQIGIDVDVAAFARVGVLRDAAILLVVAAIGKLLSPAGAIGTRTDKLLIGLGMLPRGEVGLIFATIGLQNGVLGDDLYAALLVVVLVTTLVTPLLLRQRYERLAVGAVPVLEAGEPEPPGGWLAVEAGEVRLRGRPAAHSTLELALEAARLVAAHPPADGLLDWLASTRELPLSWSPRASAAFLGLLDDGNVRSWRFLEALNVLPRALPELAAALQERREDPFVLDPVHLHHWDTLERVEAARRAPDLRREWERLEHPEWVRLAAFLVDVLGEGPDRLPAARRFVQRLGLGARAEEEVAILVTEPDVASAMAARSDAFGEEIVLQLAVFLRDPETARAAVIFAWSRADETVLRQRLTTLHELLQRVFSDPVVDRQAVNVVNRRRLEATRTAAGVEGTEVRIASAPRAYVLSHSPDVIARHALVLARWSARGDPVVVESGPEGDDAWYVDVAATDRPGLLAAVTRVLAEADLDVARAAIATWSEGVALESFVVRGAVPDPKELRTAIARSVRVPFQTSPVVDADVTFDDAASPWHTVCHVRAADHPGLLYSIAAAFAAAGVDVHAATVTVEGTEASDEFHVTGPGRIKLDASIRASVVESLRSGVRTLPGRWWQRHSLGFVSAQP